MPLSDTDNRVLAYISARGRAALKDIGAACFAVSGKPERSGIRPAAAHLARMSERGLVARAGRYYVLLRRDNSPGLFDSMIS